MKVFVACLLVIVGVNALTEEQLKVLDGHTKFCGEKCDIEYEVARGLTLKVLPEGVKNECYAGCLTKRAGFMDNEGVLQKEVIYAKFGRDKSDEAKAELFKHVDRCIEISNEDVDKRAWEINNCLYAQPVSV